MKITVAGIVKESLVDGPGIRYVIFSKGCKHNCPGCHNPDTHSFSGGKQIEIDELLKEILSLKHIDGVTFSGGDPFFQANGFKILAEKLKENNIHIIAYTGFTYEKILENEPMKALLEKIDILIDGPFLQDMKTLKSGFKGSENQRYIDVNKSLEKQKVILIDI